VTVSVTFKQLERAGRLGNALFQVAATVGIAHTIGGRPSLPPRWSYRPYFSCPDEWFMPPGPKSIEAFQWEGLDYMDERARLYLQDFNLFSDVEDEIRAAFRPSDLAQSRLGWKFDWDDAIAVHVRRGDLLTQTPGFQPALTEEAPDYYYDALLSTDEWRARPVLVFSDDPDWCDENMAGRLGRDCTVMRYNPPRSHIAREYRKQPPLDVLDLFLLTSPDSIIVSNSTFAVWAAWLGEAIEVRYPSLWFGENLAHVDTSLLIPSDDWVEIPC